MGRFTAAAILLAVHTAAAGPTLPDVLKRTAAYVADFERQLSGIVAEEHYTQQVRFAQGYPPIMNRDRRLRSDLLLVKPSPTREYMQFRDVYEVDDRAVRDHDDRLVRLFVDPPESVDS